VSVHFLESLPEALSSNCDIYNTLEAPPWSDNYPYATQFGKPYIR
jgi:hypothetical protein